jgi:hypothetical protein
MESNDDSIFARGLTLTDELMIQVIGEKILTSETVIHGGRRLQAFATRLNEGRYIHQRSLGPMVRTLYLNGNSADKHLTDADLVGLTTLILNHTSSIQGFTMRLIVTGIAELAYLHDNATSSLASLTITIGTNSDGAFPILNSLSGLRMLNLTMESRETWRYSL